MNIKVPELPNTTQIFWLGDTTANAQERATSGITFSVPPRCRNGGDLRSGRTTAFRDFSNAVDAAHDLANKVKGVYPMVSCLRLPVHRLIEPMIPRHISRLHPNEDALAALHEHYEYSKTQRIDRAWPIFDRYFETLKNELLADDSIVRLIIRAGHNMFGAAARIALAHQDDWEVILRTDMANRQNDMNWCVRDKQNNKFVKPLPAELYCEPMRDNRVLDHEAKNIISSPAVADKIIKFDADAVPPNHTISGERRPNAEPGPRIDFVFSFEANWTVPNKNPKFVTRTVQHQLGLHFGHPHTEFFNAWKLKFSGPENITWNDHRNAVTTP